MSAARTPSPTRRRLVDVAGMVVAAALLVFVATRGEVVSWLWR